MVRGKYVSVTFSTLSTFSTSLLSLTFTFYYFHYLLYLYVFSELPLAITITVLTLISCYYMTSFNYGDKKARDVSRICRCHLSNIVRDSIFCDSMEWKITFFCFVFFLSGGNRCLPEHRRDG